MSVIRRALQPPYPWHLLLAPALPLLALFGNNAPVSSPAVLAAPLITGAVFAMLVWLALLTMARDPHRAAFAGTIIVLAVMSHGTVRVLADGFGGWLFWVFYPGAVLACVTLVRASRSGAPATPVVNRIFALAALFLAIPTGLAVTVRARGSVTPLELQAPRDAGRPDVYVLVLDGYAREDVLRAQYGSTPSLAGELRRIGFAVADSATANYAQTSLAMASALNADYLPRLGFPEHRTRRSRHGLADLIRDSRFFSAFKDAGYYVRAYGSEYAMLRPSPADERPAPFGVLNEFTYAALEDSVFPAAARVMGFDRGGLSAMLHRRHLNWTLDHLAAVPPRDDGRPALVFAHLLAPHPPFVYDGAGAPRRTRMPTLMHDGTHWDEIAGGSGERYASGYADMVRFLNRRVAEMVTRVLERRRRPAIFLIHSDHGPGDRLNWDDPARTDMRERMGILLAMRFPDGETAPLAGPATPINAYRAVLNRALGAALPPVENRAFFSTWKRPFAYIEVTDRVNCAECG